VKHPAGKLCSVSSRAPEGPGPLKVRQPTERHGGSARTDEEVHISDMASQRRDARDCPQCRARGILPLDQATGEDAIPGTNENPVMMCPMCQQEFRATGMTWLGAWDVVDMTDEELHEFAAALNHQLGEMAQRMLPAPNTAAADKDNPPSVDAGARDFVVAEPSEGWQETQLDSFEVKARPPRRSLTCSPLEEIRLYALAADHATGPASRVKWMPRPSA
jgi:hypothetical protein